MFQQCACLCKDATLQQSPTIKAAVPQNHRSTFPFVMPVAAFPAFREFVKGRLDASAPDFDSAVTTWASANNYVTMCQAWARGWLWQPSPADYLASGPGLATAAQPR